MEETAVVTLNAPASAGLDLRADLADADARTCRNLNNLDIFPTPDGGGNKVQPRRPFRRYGSAVLNLFTTSFPGSGGGLSAGVYMWRYLYTDGGGVVHRSRIMTQGPVVATSHGVLSGWPTSAGTVDIFRTVAGGSTFKLVTAALDVTSNTTYDDLLDDASLGAAFVDLAVSWEPLGNTAFAQTAAADWVRLHKNKIESARIITALVRSDGSGNGGVYANYPDTSEDFELRGTIGGLPTDQPTCIAILGDLIWLARQGTALAFRDVDSTAGFTAASQPSTPSLSNAGDVAGALNANTGHIYTAQLVHQKTGIRSIPAAPLAFVGPYASKKHQINVSVPSGYNCEIYRTSDGGDLYQYLKTVSGNFTDEAADSTLSQTTISFAVGAPPGAKFVDVHKGLLFYANVTGVSGGSSDDVRKSRVGWTSERPYNAPLDPLVASDYQRDIDPDDGDEITGVKSWGELWIIFKRNRVYALSGDPPTGFRWSYVPGSDGLGCVAFRTIQATPAGLMWLSPGGVCLMRQPGSPPELISDQVRDVFVENQKDGNLDAGASLRSEPPSQYFDLTNGTAALYYHVRVQLSTTSDFAVVAFDYDTADAAERDYFRINNAPWSPGGELLSSGQRKRIAMIPPDAGSGGPAAGTTYYMRYAAASDAAAGFTPSYGDFVNCSRTFFADAEDAINDRLNWQKAVWAFALNYAPRSEYWLFVPTGSRQWCDVAYVCRFDDLIAGRPPLWRKVTVAATAGCIAENLIINSKPQQDYILLMSPDGIPLAGPWMWDGFDCDTRVAIAAAERFGAGVISGGDTLTATGTNWDTSEWKLKGNVVAVRDAAGLTCSGLITDNTDLTLTILWLNGLAPAAGDVTFVIGGTDVFFETAWMALAADGDHSALLREARIRSGASRGAVQLAAVAGRAPLRDWSRQPRRTRAVALGRDFDLATVGIDLSGHVHAIRCGSIEHTQLWEIRQIDLLVAQMGARI